MNMPSKKLWVSARDYLFISIGLLIFAIGFCVFVVPENVITGGIAGVSQIVYYLSYRAFGWGIPLAVTMYTLNIVLLAFAYRIVGKQFVIRTIYGCTLIAIYVAILQPICTHPLVADATFMNVIIGAVLSGIGMGITFAHNGSSGGTDIVAAMVIKRTNVSLGRIMQLCDLCIISSSLLIFGLQSGFEKLVYGIILLLIISITCEQVVNTNRQAVQFTIFSPLWEEIATAINNDAHRGCTVISGMGFYSKQEVKMLLVMCRKIESPTIYRIIKTIDPEALITQANVNGVYGKGFDELKLRMKAPKKDHHTTSKAPQA